MRAERRDAVIFSRFDLTLGIMGVNQWGILGYHPDTARRLMTNLVLWVMTPESTESTEPTERHDPAVEPPPTDP